MYHITPDFALSPLAPVFQSIRYLVKALGPRGSWRGDWNSASTGNQQHACIYKHV
ncbi:hypothetical protein BYT27DRAFT_7196127 [Phlegmacium glaucopus]|nr:hypothetical protein BYT27DRAFT_7196127 [Phlegmacium glaucopus]